MLTRKLILMTCKNIKDYDMHMFKGINIRFRRCCNAKEVDEGFHGKMQ